MFLLIHYTRFALAVLAAIACARPAGLGPGVVLGRRGMVATDAVEATRVGVDILRAGGNAVDAAVATAFALAVVFPEAGNVGGGGFLVARGIDGKAWALDFRETAPAAATPEMYRGRPRASLDGPLAAGVPGSVAGLYEAHHKLGRLPWTRVLAPAIRLAEDGFSVSPALAQ